VYVICIGAISPRSPVKHVPVRLPVFAHVQHAPRQRQGQHLQRILNLAVQIRQVGAGRGRRPRHVHRVFPDVVTAVDFQVREQFANMRHDSIQAGLQRRRLLVEWHADLVALVIELDGGLGLVH
jgi:hypothetical protein